ncbi:heme peroxidase [Dermacoccus abyssi]|uniref:Heme peroxidase n=1 Tax=Dermacoccus abyssi TaxID=322596 RepID=A0ABX5Z985_9MICO|nr:heme peroxidase [Dermacoccus abyssi]
MMELRGEEIELVTNAARVDLGDDTRWFKPEGYTSVALCLIDSIYSTGNHYSGVIDAVRRYRERRAADGADATFDSASDLALAAESWGGPEGLADVTKHWRCWPSKNAPFKAQAVIDAADLLRRAGLETVEDVRRELSAPEAQIASPVKSAWLGIPGQRSGLTWTYFLMLAGVPGVKADRMVTRYIARVLDRVVDPHEAALLVGAAADERGLSRTLLDHAIWRHESGRPIYTDSEAPPHLQSADGATATHHEP